MNVLIIATENCNHRPLVEERLKKLNIPYQVRFIDSHPERVEKFEVSSSPNIIVDEEVIFSGDCGQPLPTEGELKALFSKR